MKHHSTQKQGGWKECLEGSGQGSAPGKAKLRGKPGGPWPHAAKVTITKDGGPRTSLSSVPMSHHAHPGLLSKMLRAARTTWVYPCTPWSALGCLVPCKHPRSLLYHGAWQSLWFLLEKEEELRPAYPGPVNPLGTINLPNRG